MRIIITSPSSEANHNVSGMSAVVNFITRENTSCKYTHFALGKRDRMVRGLLWLVGILVAYAKWLYVMIVDQRAMIHFNLAFDRRGLMRDLPLILVARLLRRRMIVHMHGGEFMAGEGMPSWLKALVGLTLTGCHIIVLSQREQTILRRYVKTAKLFVLPNCVKVNEADCFDRSYAKDGPLTVLFLGRIALSKGIDVIYRAMVALGKMPGNIRFVMAGAGPDERVYVDKFRELLGPRFEYRGIVDGIAKTELLKECDVFLLPSLFEGMPMALLETMALGLVPIVTNVGSIASVVTDGKNGILLHTQSPEQVVDALSMLMADKAYLQVLSQHARQYILANCRPDAYFERLNALYEYD